MFKGIAFILLLLYFVYFYYSFSKPVPPPSSGHPSPPRPYHFELQKIPAPLKTNTFQFLVNSDLVWEHTLPENPYLFHRSTNTIFIKDACYHAYHLLEPATGQPLYDIIKKNPDVLKQFLSYKENSPYTVQNGNVFFYECDQRRIKRLGICPSGHIFQNHRCISVSACTGKPNLAKIPDPTNIRRYIECKNNREFPDNCPKDTFFYADKCVDDTDLRYTCILEPNKSTFKVNDITMGECRDGKLITKTCPQGTKLFKKNYCESAICDGKLDGTKLPLPERQQSPFKFIPGYVTCFENEVNETHECPTVWDDMLSKGDDLTHLPMVFDNSVKKCSVPSFCENVFPSRGGVLVPLYEFTKDVRNWFLSDLYDSVAGYECLVRGQKRRASFSPALRIKQFKLENACDSQTSTVPLYGEPAKYYDCTSNQIETCSPNEYYDGAKCSKMPKDAFTYKNIPMFKFKNLHFDSWILPQAANPHPKVKSCQPPESTHIKHYDICSHPDCAKYDFLSMIPDLAILLQNEKFKCHYNSQKRTLEKEPVDLNYRFWEQRIIPDGVSSNERCVVGQKLKTGNIIWDSTIYATCDAAKPFIFCPSIHTRKIIPVGPYYACDAPDTNRPVFNPTDNGRFFMRNEVRRIIPINWNTTFKFKSKQRQQLIPLPQGGQDVQDRLSLYVTHPVEIQFQYRVTYPPNIVFKYDNNDTRTEESSTYNKAFSVHHGDFTENAMSFLEYKPEIMVTSMEHQHL